MIWQAGPILLSLMIFILLLEALVPSLQLISSKEILNSLSQNIESNQDEFSLTWVFIFIGGFFLQLLLVPINRWIRLTLGERAVVEINLLLLDSFRRSPGLLFFEEKKYRDRLETLKDHSSWLPIQLIEFSAGLLTDTLAGIGVIMVIFSISPILAILVLLALLPLSIIENWFNSLEWEYEKEGATLRRKLSYIRTLLLSRYSAKETKLFKLGEYFIEKYSEAFSILFMRFKILQHKAIAAISLASLLPSLAIGFGAFWLIYQLKNNSLEVGDLVLYIGASAYLNRILNGVSSSIIDTIDLWRRGRDFLLFTIDQPFAKAAPLPCNIPAGASVKIEFRDAYFAYPQALDIPILRGINFTIQPGEKVALVGENGSGKSTIIKLLCRFYTLQSGEILINDTNIYDWDEEEWRKHLTAIFQNYGQYGLSLEENIALGDLEKIGNIKSTKNIAKQVGIDTLAESLPHSYKTMLGLEWGGVDLSGGQWQKVALARALIKPANLLLLDEPTASIDVQAEYNLLRELRSLVENRTVLITSHRLSTVRIASRILTLKDGQIVEEGTHDELINGKGLYADMYSLYRDKFEQPDEELL